MCEASICSSLIRTWRSVAPPGPPGPGPSRAGARQGGEGDGQYGGGGEAARQHRASLPGRRGRRSEGDRDPCRPTYAENQFYPGVGYLVVAPGILTDMPRAMWSGAISFGLVNIPIKLFNAVSRKSVHFNQLDSRTGARIQYKKVSAEDGEEVPSEAITKGYQLSSGDYVLVGDDELAALDPEANRTIDIEQFVDLAEIDPLFYDSAYYVAPDKAARKPYALLAQAMEREGKVGDRPVRHAAKQYLAALRPRTAC